MSESTVRIAVGDGSPEGTNSAYFLPARATLIDPGSYGQDGFERLRAGLAAADYALADIDHVVVTHWHADHFGNAPRVADAADAEIHMHQRDAPLLADYAAARERRVERDAATLDSWGVPAERVARVRELDTPTPLPATTPVVSHADGDTVAGLELLHTPGHTAGHLAVRAEGATFVGDTLLPTYTPNVGGSDTRMDEPLGTYLRSLDRLSEMTGEFYPGHGVTVAVPERVETIREHHEERSRRVLDRLRERGEVTPWAVAGDLFGELRGVHVKFGAGEAAAHLASLAAGPYAERVGTAPLRYALVESPSEGSSLLPPRE